MVNNQNGDDIVEENQTQSSAQSHPEPQAQEETKTWALDDDPYELGAIYLYRWVDAQDYMHKWYEAQIIDLELDENPEYKISGAVGSGGEPGATRQVRRYSKFRIKVHYKGWKDKFDEWVDLLSGDNTRIRTLHTFSPRQQQHGRYAIGDSEREKMKVGYKMDCMDSCDTWYPAQIIKETPYLFLIHYEDWGDKYNEWINKDSYRFAMLNTMSNKNYKPAVDQSYDTSRDVVMTDGTPKNVGKKSEKQDRSELQSSLPSTSTMSYMTDPMKSGNKDSAMQTETTKSKITTTTATTATTGRGIDNTDKSNRNGTHSTMPDKYTATTTDNNNNNYNHNNGQTNNESDSENKLEVVVETTNTSNNDESEKKERDNDLSTDETMTDKDKYRNAYLSNFKPTREDELQFRRQMLVHNMRIVDMGEDGNCLFRSISHQMYGDERYHTLIRQKCVDYLECQKDYFSSFVVMDFTEYCQCMRRSGVWGGNVEIQAFSEMYDRPINIYAYSDRPMRTFNDNHNQTGKPPIRLSYHFNSHYNSIVPRNHSPPLANKDPGVYEDEKVKMAGLRAINALKQTVQASDINATEAELFAVAMQESRRAFETEKGQGELDAAIQASLEQMRNQEQNEMNKALAISMGITVEEANHADNPDRILENIEDTEIQQAMLKSMEANPDTYMTAITAQTDDSTWPPAVKTVVKELEYTFEEAMEAYSIFESSCRELGNEHLVNQMVDYLSQKRQQQQLGF